MIYIKPYFICLRGTIGQGGCVVECKDSTESRSCPDNASCSLRLMDQILHDPIYLNPVKYGG